MNHSSTTGAVNSKISRRFWTWTGDVYRDCTSQTPAGKRDEELAILQKAATYFAKRLNEVCLYWKTSGWVQHQSNVPVLRVARSGWYTWCQRRTRITRVSSSANTATALSSRLLPGKTALRCPTPDGWTACSGLPLNVKTVAASLRRQGLRAKASRSSARSATAHTACLCQKICWAGFLRQWPEPEVGRRHHVLTTDEGWLYLAVVIDLWSRAVMAGQCRHAWRRNWPAMPCRWAVAA